LNTSIRIKIKSYGTLPYGLLNFLIRIKRYLHGVRYGMAYLKKVPSQPHNPKLFKKRKGSDFINQKLSLA